MRHSLTHVCLIFLALKIKSLNVWILLRNSLLVLLKALGSICSITLGKKKNALNQVSWCLLIIPTLEKM
jgi:hypothetical protein